MRTSNFNTEQVTFAINTDFFFDLSAIKELVTKTPVSLDSVDRSKKIQSIDGTQRIIDPVFSGRFPSAVPNTYILFGYGGYKEQGLINRPVRCSFRIIIDCSQDEQLTAYIELKVPQTKELTLLM